MKTETITKAINICDWVLVALATTVSILFVVECNFSGAIWALIAGFYKLESIYRFKRVIWLENLIEDLLTGKPEENPERQEGGQEETGVPEDIPESKENG